ncbi:hypothetical protein MBLNU459_g0531t1 [Dothideomycetes sp. NU459]
MAPGKNKVGKAVIKTDLPFEASSIPSVSREQGTIVADLLCRHSLLEPIGRFRDLHRRPPSDGICKTNRKRRRASKNAHRLAPTPELLDKAAKPLEQPLEQPPLLQAITIGLNSTSRHLEEQSSQFVLKALSEEQVSKQSQASEEQPTGSPGRGCLAAVFLPKAASDVMYAHLPSLCYTASLVCGDSQGIRLILLDPSTERRLASTLGIPRAGVVGIMEDTPGAAPLLDYVREIVPTVELPWMTKAFRGYWMGTRIDAETPGHSR